MKKKNAKKTILVISDKSNCGKTKTILKVFTGLCCRSGSTVFIEKRQHKDIFAAVTIGKYKIGIESTGSSTGRIAKQRPLDVLAATYKASEWFDSNLSKCSIIVCSAKTGGTTVNEIKRVARIHGYRTVWRSTYVTNNINHRIVNNVAAKEIIAFIDEIITGRI